MEREAHNTPREEENCHFADDTQLKVTFKEKTSGFRYYICPLGCMWDWAHHPFILAQGCRTSYTDRNCGIKNAERQPSSTSASKWSDCDCWSAINTFREGALSQKMILASSLPLKNAIMDNFILKNPQNLVHQMCRETTGRETTQHLCPQLLHPAQSRDFGNISLCLSPGHRMCQTWHGSTKTARSSLIFLEQLTKSITFALQRTLPSPPINPRGKCHRCHKARVSSSSQPYAGKKAAHPMGRPNQWPWQAPAHHLHFILYNAHVCF